MKNRDDFPQEVKDTLYELVGGKCSNPSCQYKTRKMSDMSEKRNIMGRAVYIASVSKENPRYDFRLNENQRNIIENGIWLCELCAKKVESGDGDYSVALLKHWKYQAEYEQEKRIKRESKLLEQDTIYEKCRETAYEKIKKAVSELHDIVRYANIFCKQNFGNRTCDAEMKREIETYYRVYEEELNYIVTYQQKYIVLSRVLKEYGAVLDIALLEEVNCYLKFFNDKLQNDYWDRLIDFISYFLVKLVKQFNEMDSRKKRIDEILQQRF